ncbi:MULTISPECIES: glutathione synthase [Thiomicrorhabdus]|uniref:Glutathione synthetase n=1 Tax=Thiomicrorhabdus heinhorstiae TaxID=2748010 RepID=A0ABS0BXK9_9GAMM|nr:MULTISPECIES: glutathione synthase [Thiomicrorhabdus]MBF6057815.1 glutathione synthase [Thiomicrorhabdus heinhorstiae]
MSLILGIVMDPIERIKPYKDSSFAMLLEAQRRGYQLRYMEPQDIYLQDGKPFGRYSELKVWDRTADEQYFGFGASFDAPLAEMDIILIRQDPPFNNDYLYSTHMLELAEAEGVLVVNKPQTLRDANEKLFASWFPQCIPPTLVSANPDQLKEFVKTHQDTIFKPLDAMGGASIFRVRDGDPNLNVIIETMTDHGKHHIMAQIYLPEIKLGDKRILLINGEPIDYSLARIPAEGETRGNIAAGGTGVGMELTEHERWLCSQIAPALRAKGLHFVGLDVIGDYITEINVTSPTCIRELDAQFHLNIAGTLFDHLENVIKS